MLMANQSQIILILTSVYSRQNVGKFMKITELSASCRGENASKMLPNLQAQLTSIDALACNCAVYCKIAIRQGLCRFLTL